MENIFYIIAIVLLVIYNALSLRKIEKLEKIISDLAESNYKHIVEKAKKEAIVNIMEKLKNPIKK